MVDPGMGMSVWHVARSEICGEMRSDERKFEMWVG